MSVQEQVKQIVAGMERFREANLETKFTDEQRSYVGTFQGTTFKERLLRACNYGRCKACGKDTKYVEKLRFMTYCSTECSSSTKMVDRHSVLRQELAASKLELIGELPDTVHDELITKCSSGHLQTITLYHLRYGLKFTCGECNQLAAREATRARRAEAEIHQALTREKNRNAALARREASKAHTLADRERLVGTLSTVECNHCKSFTRFRLMGKQRYVYAPKFCDEKCRADYLKARRLKTIQTRLNLIAAQKPWIQVDSAKDSIKQTFTFTGCGHSLELNYKNVSSFQQMYNDPQQRCPRCSAFESRYAERVAKLFVDQGIKVIKNDRTVLGNRQEIDVYLPDYKLGVELDGIWWHSDFYKDDDYHLLKTAAAQVVGVKLIHIFSDEFDERPNVVESRLLAAVGISQKLNARDCEVRELPSVVKRDFLERTHIQGDAGSSVNLGLYSEMTLVAVMTFRKPRDQHMQKKYQWELIRYASELNTAVRGGAGKLLRYFETKWKPTSILSYADKRWSRGELYHLLGFKLVRESAPGYSYVIDGKRESRGKFQKKSLSSLPGADGLTEREIMRARGHPQIYDCGQMVFERVNLSSGR